jgi:hypothetical protein
VGIDTQETGQRFIFNCTIISAYLALSLEVEFGGIYHIGAHILGDLRIVLHRIDEDFHLVPFSGIVLMILSTIQIFL